MPTDLKGRTKWKIFHRMFQSSFCLLNICEAGISKIDNDNDFLERKRSSGSDARFSRSFASTTLFFTDK
jgi:hypothetical protein